MRSRMFFCGLVIVVLFSCNSQAGSGSDTAAEIKTPDTVKVVEETRTDNSYRNDYNAIEQVFGNENWLSIDQKDSNYLYISRLGDFSVNTYAYKIIKGDSAQVKHGKMERRNNTINWEFDGRPVTITGATGTRIVAVAAGNDQYEFIRLDANHLQVTYPNKEKKVLRKTLSFSTFLIRSRYDYTHGTKYAFDSVEFSTRRPA